MKELTVSWVQIQMVLRFALTQNNQLRQVPLYLLQQEQQQFALDQQRRSEEALRNDQIDREQIESREQIAKMKDDTTKQRMEIQKQLKIQDLINKYNK